MYNKFNIFTISLFSLAVSTACFSADENTVQKGFYTRLSIGKAISNNFQDLSNEIESLAKQLSEKLSSSKGKTSIDESLDKFGITGEQKTSASNTMTGIANQIKNYDLKADLKFLLSCAWGFYYSSPLIKDSVDLIGRYEFEYIVNRIDIVNNSSSYSRNMLTLMSNIYIEAEIKNIPFRPYFGVGLGLSAMRSELNPQNLLVDYRSAVQCKVGASLPITFPGSEIVSVGLGYRYFIAMPSLHAIDLKTHNIELNLTFDF